MTSPIFSILYYCVACAILCGTVADAKGRSIPSWAVLGFLFGIFSLIAIHGIPAVPSGLKELKQCRKCGEWVHLVATVCRHCRTEVSMDALRAEMVEALQSPSHADRMAARQRLLQIESEDGAVAEAVCQLAMDAAAASELKNATNALALLRDLGDSRVADRLVQLLSSSPPDLAPRAALALQALATAAEVPALVEILRSDTDVTWHVTAGSREVLLAMGPTALPALEALLVSEPNRDNEQVASIIAAIKACAHPS